VAFTAFIAAVATTGKSLATLWMGGMLGPSNVSRIPSDKNNEKQMSHFYLIKFKTQFKRAVESKT
jgi:hypothetical protein